MGSKTKISQLDQDAMERAWPRLKTLNRDRYTQLKAELDAGDDWERVSAWAAASVQYKLLGLQPWQRSPSELRLDGTQHQSPSDDGGRLLLKRMLDAGLSRYEPDPLRALAEAEA